MKKDEFYIGWQDKESRAYQRVFLRFFGAALGVMLAFAVVFVNTERGFIDSYFDFGNLTEKKGRLVMEPVPGLLTVADGQMKTIPLVGFGKFGARPVLDTFAASVEGDLSDYEVTLRGTVFSYQDKLWMELTEGEKSIVSFVKTEPLTRSIATIGSMDFSGEIVDPKCFFGVMNPATKAVHRSCAIRCISGGAPPVLGLRRNGVFVDYYFLTDQGSNPLNQEVLPYVGLPVKVTGTVVVYDDWKVLKVVPEQLQIVLTKEQNTLLTLCVE